MKLPNGYGSVYKLSGKRRKPWVARKTIGWKPIPEKQKAYPIYQIIGYYEKRELALAALVDYNENPYDIKAASITFAEVYEKWSEKKFVPKDELHPNGISESNIKGYKAAYKLCSSVENMRFSDIKLDHLQNVVDTSGKNKPTLRKLKVLFNELYKYAVMHDIITKDRNISEYVDISNAGNPNALNRKPFKKSEVKTVWENIKKNEYITVVLMLIYSGVRISELLDLDKKNVNLDEQWFDVVEAKTESGIRRVPIADKVLDFFRYWYNKNNSNYLLSTPEGEHFEYRNYYDSYWKPCMDSMNLNHTPHDTRHTCISLLTAAKVDERFIKKIVGHKGTGVTQRVYTHLETAELLTEINKI